MDAATARAIVAGHHVFDGSTMRVVGDASAPDPRVQMQLLARANARPGPAVDWSIATGAPIHAASATYGDSWVSSSPTDFVVFAVDGTASASRGVLSGTSAASTPPAAKSASLFVATNLYDGPDLAGYAFDASSDPAGTVAFGRTAVLLDYSTLAIYALSTRGDLYCFKGIARGPQSAPAAPLTPCAVPASASAPGAAWPYHAGAGHTVTHASPFPVFDWSGAISAIYFGDDQGALHCVNTLTTAGRVAATSCWGGGPASSLVEPAGDAAALSSPVVLNDPATGVAEIFLGDDRGRFFRVFDRGVTPTPTNGVARYDACTTGAACAAPPFRWAMRSGPSVDSSHGLVFVTTAGNDATGAARGAVALEFPLAASANWQPVGTKTLTKDPLDGPPGGGPAVDYTNGWIYAGVHNELVKVKFPFDADPSNGVYAAPLANRVAAPVGDVADDSFPIGLPFPYFDPPYYDAVYVASARRVERFGCQAAAAPPVLEGVSTNDYGGAIETAFVLDWANGNLYFGVDDGAAGGALVQYPPNTVATAWTCPAGQLTSATAACGAAGCVSTCATCAAVGGDTVACDASTGGMCVVASCPAGFADCDHNATNGCEIDVAHDVNNCGGCAAGTAPQTGSPKPGVVCSSANATPSCVDGACSAACNAGYGRCAGDTSNDGCPAHVACGRASAGGSCCGASCGVGQVCALSQGLASCESTSLPQSCVTVGEHGSATLACAEADQVISAITFASYGNPGGACGAFTVGACDVAFVETVPLSAGAEGVSLDGAGGRAAETVRQLVEAQCLGKTSCGLAAESYAAQGPAPQRQLGDPCPDTAKRLYVQFACSCPACESDLDCGAAAPKCNTTAHACGCTADGDCKDASKPHCDMATAQCVACAGPAQCATGSACDTTPGAARDTCVACTANSDCAAPTPVCDTTSADPKAYACVGCLVDSDCGADLRCDGVKKACVPNVCGDGVRDPLKEECDNGAANAEGVAACSTTCQEQDFAAAADPAGGDAGLPDSLSRTWGQARHPLAAGPGGFAAAMVEEMGTDVHVRVEAFDAKGVRVASFPSIGIAGQVMAISEPVIAPVSASAYAVAWTDFGGDGDEQGIAMAVVDTKGRTVGPVTHANATTSFAQSGVDAVWTGSSLVVAWTDGSNASTAPDLKLRTFDGSLKAMSAEVVLAGTADAESDVTLAPFNGSWAAAWRVGSAGAETVHVRTAAGVEWTVGPVAAGPSGERPALVQVGASSLALAFSVGTSDGDGGVPGTKVQGVILDTSAPGAVSVGDWGIAGSADAGVRPVAEAAPALAMSGGTLAMATWTMAAAAGDPKGEELWIGTSLTPAPPTRDVATLPAQASHRLGDQSSPQLVGGLLGEGPRVGGWEDRGGSLGVSARPELVLRVLSLVTAKP